MNNKGGYSLLELEFLELISYFKMRLSKEHPKSFLRMKEKNDEMDELENIEHTIHEFAKWKENNENKDLKVHEEQWNTMVEVICPECKSHLNLKPVGEIQLDDGMTYFQFYCQDCYLNFESLVPNNNTEALIEYYQNILTNKKDYSDDKRKEINYNIFFNRTKNDLNRLKTAYGMEMKNKKIMNLRYEGYLDVLNKDIAKYRLNKIITSKRWYRFKHYFHIRIDDFMERMRENSYKKPPKQNQSRHWEDRNRYY
jgi:hypothetical protein